MASLEDIGVAGIMLIVVIQLARAIPQLMTWIKSRGNGADPADSNDTARRKVERIVENQKSNQKVDQIYAALGCRENRESWFEEVSKNQTQILQRMETLLENQDARLESIESKLEV